MKIYFSWDDGHPDDFKLKELFEKYEIPCMLFVPRFNSENRSVLCENELKSIASDFIEIGAHTYNHMNLNNLSYQLMVKEIIEGKNYLENTLNRKIEHFCLPGGQYNKDILKYSSSIFKTIRSAETTYLHYHLPLVNTTFHFYPRGLGSILYNSLKSKSELLKYLIANKYAHNYFKFMYDFINYSHLQNKSYDIMIWGHSWELSQFELWNELEEFIKFISINYKDSATKYSEIHNH